MKIALGLLMAAMLPQTADTPEAHVALAKAAAGDDYQNLFNFVCPANTPRGGGGGQAAGQAPAGGRGAAAAAPA